MLKEFALLKKVPFYQKVFLLQNTSKMIVKMLNTVVH